MFWNMPTLGYRDVWGEFDRLQREMNRLFEPVARRARVVAEGFPPVNMWANEDEVLLTAEVPGVDPDKLEITVKNDTVILRGERPSEELKEGESYLRQERGAGTFVRTFNLPFHVDGEHVGAEYRMGILQIRLPRREEDKPKKIAVQAS